MCYYFKAKMHLIQFRLGLRPRPRWEAHSAVRPCLDLRGPTSKGREGTDRGAEGKEKENKGGRKGGKRKGRNGMDGSEREGKGDGGNEGEGFPLLKSTSVTVYF